MSGGYPLGYSLSDPLVVMVTRLSRSGGLPLDQLLQRPQRRIRLFAGAVLADQLAGPLRQLAAGHVELVDVVEPGPAVGLRERVADPRVRATRPLPLPLDRPRAVQPGHRPPHLEAESGDAKLLAKGGPLVER